MVVIWLRLSENKQVSEPGSPHAELLRNMMKRARLVLRYAIPPTLTASCPDNGNSQMRADALFPNTERDTKGPNQREGG